MILVMILLCLLIVALCLWLLALRGNSSAPEFYGLGGVHYAHRGLYNLAREVPENSKAAFRLAAKHRYGAELDVHLSQDKRLVIMHDENLLRTTGLDLKICDAKTEDLARLRLQGTGETVPCLEEVLAIYNGQNPLVIEIKTCGKNYDKLTYRVCRTLDHFPNVRFCIESFDPRVLIWLRKNRPEIIRGQLAMNLLKLPKEQRVVGWFSAFVLSNLLTNFLTQPDFVAYKYEDRKNLSFRLCKLLWHVREFSWTIQSQETADVVLNDGGSIIFEGFAAQ